MFNFSSKKQIEEHQEYLNRIEFESQVKAFGAYIQKYCLTQNKFLIISEIYERHFETLIEDLKKANWSFEKGKVLGSKIDWINSHVYGILPGTNDRPTLEAEKEYTLIKFYSLE